MKTTLEHMKAIAHFLFARYHKHALGAPVISEEGKYTISTTKCKCGFEVAVNTVTLPPALTKDACAVCGFVKGSALCTPLVHSQREKVAHIDGEPILCATGDHSNDARTRLDDGILTYLDCGCRVDLDAQDAEVPACDAPTFDEGHTLSGAPLYNGHPNPCKC